MNHPSSDAEAHEVSHASASTGLVVFVILAVLTGVEFAVAKSLSANLAPLVVMAIIKAALILWYFMHVARAWLSHGGAE